MEDIKVFQIMATTEALRSASRGGDDPQLGKALRAMAGDIAREKLTEYSMTACDLLDLLPQAFRNYATECSWTKPMEDARD